MPAKGLLSLSLAAAFAFANANAFAQDHPHGSFFGAFDLKSAVLSPEPLGPPSQFKKTPPSSSEYQVETHRAAKPQAEGPRTVATSHKSKPRQKIATAAKKPKSNPLNAYARDTRSQVWPCVGDGICTWRQPR